MARRKRRLSSRPAGRDLTIHRPRIANRLELARVRLPRRNLQLLEDRRLFSPVTVRPVSTLRRDAVVRTRPVIVAAPPVVASPSRSRRSTKSGLDIVPSRVRFGAPRRVLICVRRRRRREVLHAKGVAGRRGLRRPRRNFWSEVSC